MKKLFLFLIALIFITLSTTAQQQIIVGKNYTNPNEVTLITERGVSTTIKFDLNELNLTDVRTDYGTATKMTSAKAPVMLEAGVPELIYLPTAIIIPDVGSAELEITYGEYIEIENVEIAPSKGNLSRSIDPATVPYVKGEVYNQNAFFPGIPAMLNEPFIMRDVRGQTIFAYPVQYNPVTRVLRIYSEMTVTVNFNDNEGINEFTNQKRNKTLDPTFNDMYKNLFINHSSLSRAYPTEEVGEMLIICFPAFMDDMKPYVDWKRTIGRKTTMIPSSTAGATPTAIKTYIQNYYNNPENNLAYVLLVGDAPQIPPHGTTSVPSDNIYGQLVGSDPYMEILIGRISAENVAHVQTQVQRSIWYERDLTTADTWIPAAMGIAHNEGPGHDGGEYDHQHMDNIRNRLLAYGYSPVYQEYTGNCPGVPNTNATQMSQNMNSGVSMINFCNHGSETGWSVGGFSNTHVNALQNAGKLPFIYSVACLNGRFTHSSPCFAEAWMRATQNGQPTGSVVNFMATISIGWQPPMTAQDEFVNICMDLPSPYGSVQPGIKRTFAGAALNSTQKMLLIHGVSSNLDDFNSWQVFGDPTLMIRTKTPQTMTVTHNPVIFFGMNEFTVNCDAEEATVTMSYIDNDEVVILGSAAVNGGIANLTFDPITMPIEITVCVTGRDRVTYIGDVLATPSDGPYVVPAGYSVMGEEKLTYISTNTEIEVTLKNVGVDPANGPINVTLVCNDPQLIVTQATAQCATIAPDGTATVTFKVTVANDVLDGKTFLTDVIITGSSKTTWEGKLPLRVYAPNFSLQKVLIDGVENGNLPKGAVAKITTVVGNKGGADAFDVTGILDLDSEYIILACDDETKRGTLFLPAGEDISFDFYVITDPAMPFGYEANIGLLVSALYGRSYQTSFKAICSGSSAYCSSGDQNCSDGDKFTSVILYKTSDPSNLLINNTDGTCSGSGYQDFTNINVNLEPGENYTIKVKCGYSSQQVGGWVDINGNNIFDNNEKLITLNCSTSGQEYTTTFTIPQDFAPGAHRFRLVSKYNAAPTPCGNSSYGQTHDYTVTFPELYHRVQNVNAELFAEEEIITITWEAPEEGTPIGYNIYREGNLLNTELLNVTTFTEEDITEGIYVYNVTAVYEGDKESFAEMSNVICNYENITPPLPCETPVNLSGEVDENECIVAVIRWNMLEGIDGVILLNYNIYRDNVKIAEALPSDQEYRDELSENGTYVYHVSAVYEHCEESPWTGEVTVEISCVNINEVQADVFQIFPNPAKGELNITGAVIPTYVSIYNLMGQTMYETGQCAPNMKISVSSLPTGIYFVKIVSENGTTTKKVVVEN